MVVLVCLYDYFVDDVFELVDLVGIDVVVLVE